MLVARMGRATWGYSASAYYYDVLPLALMQRVGRLRFLIVPVFHLIPGPNDRGWTPQNVAAWLEQRFVLMLVRRTKGAIVVDNDTLIGDLVRLGFKAPSIVLSGMGVPARVPPAAAMGECRAAFDCIYVGRLSTAKGVPLLLEAWSRVCKEMPGKRLALVGSRDSGLDLDDCIQRHGLSSAEAQIFEGLSDAEVQSMLRRSTFFAIASKEEGYCLAIGEAMREGLPCVTFDLPAFRFAYPYGRLVVSSGEAGDFAEAMRALLHERQLYDRLSADIARYSFRSWGEVAEDLWNACLRRATEES